MKPLVAYYRVSTDKQGRSGLGLEAQEAAVEQYRASTGGQLLKAFREVESGKKKDRPELLKALFHAQRSGATLVVAKLDRLSRNVAFLAALMESGVDFIACDMPHANKFTIHILVAVAEHEAVMISKRTKEALAAYKARGGKLGATDPRCPHISPEAARRGQRKGAEANREKAKAAYADLLPMIQQLRSEGKSFPVIAGCLNAEGFITMKGKKWSATQVFRVLGRVSS